MTVTQKISDSVPRESMAGTFSGELKIQYGGQWPFEKLCLQQFGPEYSVIVDLWWYFDPRNSFSDLQVQYGGGYLENCIFNLSVVWLIICGGILGASVIFMLYWWLDLVLTFEFKMVAIWNTFAVLMCSTWEFGIVERNFYWFLAFIHVFIHYPSFAYCLSNQMPLLFKAFYAMYFVPSYFINKIMMMMIIMITLVLC